MRSDTRPTSAPLALITGVALACLSPAFVCGQSSPEDSSALESYRQAATTLDADLRKSLDELAAVRARIASEKPPLATASEEIASDLREKRRQGELARTTREAAESAAEKANTEMKVWREEKLYIESLVGDFRRTAESGELVVPGDPSTALPQDPIDLASRLVDRLGLNRGILVEDGEIVGTGGVITPGTFTKAGPVRLFVSQDRALAGLVGDGPDLRPHVIHPVSDSQGIDALTQGKRATIAFDPTLGLAVELAKTETGLIEHTKKGGFWIYPIVFLGLLALLVALIKWLQLSTIRNFAGTAVQRVIDSVNAGESEKARAETSRIRHPARKILEQGIHFVQENPDASRENLEESLYERYLEAGPALQRGLPIIAIAAATAPLLGLLGTVTGMMETFRLITVFGSGDAKQLASGIAEALITTEYGLIVAIPSLILHALLSRKVQGVKSTMEMSSLAFLNGVALDEATRKVPARA